MRTQHKTWNIVRRIYLGAGVLAMIGAVSAFVWPSGLVSPYLYASAAALVLTVAIGASDEFLERVHRIFWHRRRPK